MSPSLTNAILCADRDGSPLPSAAAGTSATAAAAALAIENAPIAARLSCPRARFASAHAEEPLGAETRRAARKPRVGAAAASGDVSVGAGPGDDLPRARADDVAVACVDPLDAKTHVDRSAFAREDRQRVVDLDALPVARHHAVRPAT